MRRWLVVLAALALAVNAYTWFEREASLAGRADVIEFERLTGGLGMGASAVPYWDLSGFDPRLEPDCTCTLWPVPGGYLFSPEHRRTVWEPPESFGRAGIPSSRDAGAAR